MKMYNTVVITALLCSLLWIGCTALLIDEYIKVVQAKEFQIKMKDWDIINNKNLIKTYDDALKYLIFTCETREEIRIRNKVYVCFEINKV